MKTSQSRQIELNEYILNSMRQCVLLQSLSLEQFDKIVGSSHIIEIADNDILFEQGDALNNIYLLISGGIKLQRLSPTGDEKVFEIIRPGHTFAEAVLFLGGSKYPLSAISVSSSVVVAINAQCYLQLLNESNVLCMSLLAKLSQRLHKMVNEVDRLTLHNATFRLVDYLLSHVPEEQHQHTNIILQEPKNVIASLLSIKPETLSRTLKSLSKQGLIRLEGSTIELLEINKLRALISLT